MSTDQRGFPLDSPPDIGAFQVQSGPQAWQVNTTADGWRVPSGKLDLRGAVNLADVLPGAHTITFAPSVFATAQTINLTSGQLELSNTGGPQTITGPAAGVTVSGGGNNRVFQVDGGVTASVSGMTITGGGGTADRGGGLLNLGNVTLSNSTISGNKASTSGGGLANYGTATLTNCTISGNTAGQNGGGLLSYDSSGGGTATLTNCTVSGNMAGGAGGGLFLKGPALKLTGCTISNNTATQAGGGLWLYASSAGVATLTNCTVAGNTAGDSGGGVENFTGVATLTGCTLSANIATQDGGGFMNNGNSSTTLTNCTITGNMASGGGGLYNRGTVSVLSCTITANSSGVKGGGGWFNVSGPATLTDTIVAGNTNGSTPPAPSDIAGGISVSGTFNLIGTGGSGGLTNGVNGNIVGVANPGLAKLGSYGGPTQTMAVLPGSPVIGKGDPKSSVPSDQRGVRRPSGSVDIGAFQDRGFTHHGRRWRQSAKCDDPYRISHSAGRAGGQPLRRPGRRRRDHVHRTLDWPVGSLAVRHGDDQIRRPSQRISNGQRHGRRLLRDGLGQWRYHGHKLQPDQHPGGGEPVGDPHPAFLNSDGRLAVPHAARDLRRRPVRQPRDRRQHHPGDGRFVAGGLRPAARDDDGDGLGWHRHVHQPGRQQGRDHHAAFHQRSHAHRGDVQQHRGQPRAATGQLAIHTQPSPTATAGLPFSTQPVVYVEDQFGNLVTGDNTTQVTVTSLPSGSGPLQGTTTVTVSGGIATFTNLADNTAETITLHFTSAPVADLGDIQQHRGQPGVGGDSVGHSYSALARPRRPARRSARSRWSTSKISSATS